MRPAALPLLVILLLAPARLGAQVIRGALLDAETEQPIARGVVALHAADSARIGGVLTDSAGGFLLTAPRAGGYRLGAERIGYRSAVSPVLRLGASDTLVVEFLLSTQLVVLDPVVVTARSRRRNPLLEEFDRRAESGRFGVQITRAEIERRSPITTTALLRSIPSVRLIPRPVGGGNDVLVRGCLPSVFIDGTRVRLHGMSIDDLITPLQLEGIEVYPSPAEAPVEYTGFSSGCGVILIWSRRGE